MSATWWDNTETWTTREGETLRLEDMAPSHRANLIRWIYRRQRKLRDQMRLYYLVGSLQMNGDMAIEALEQLAWEVTEMPTEDLIESLPLVKRLRELNRPRIFSSKTPRDLNHDPFPRQYHGYPEPDPAWDHIQHNPPNPILSAFRNDVADVFVPEEFDVAAVARSWIDGDALDLYEDMHDPLLIEHARRVLTRLARLSEWAELEAAETADDYRQLPIHRTEAGYPNCATCDGGGCLDCTDPAY